jgi:hypothetical protein
MKIRFLGNYSKLKRCVLRTRLDGMWRELKNNHKQFRTYDNGILNWWQSTGTLQFQGEKTSAVKLERAFTKIASANGLLHSKHTSRFNEEADKPKELIAEARTLRRKLKALIKRAEKIPTASEW